MVDIFGDNLDEKMKPKTLADVVGQAHVVRRMEKVVRTGKMSHCLFAGPPGVGKTSVATALAHELFGDNWHFNIHIFNASDNRGIDFVRKDIQELTMVEPIGALFQIIFLDEADAFTSDAQTALREIMQKHTATTKFILGCNYINSIIEPIQDRCRVFRFTRLHPNDIELRLNAVIKSEGMNIAPDAIKYISEHSKGSLRTALSHVEMFAEDGVKITLDTVKEDLKFVDGSDAKYIFDYALKGDIIKYEERLFALYYDGGFRAEEILDEMLSIVDGLKAPVNVKKNIVWKMGDYNWRISQGSNELLQLRCFLRELEGMM